MRYIDIGELRDHLPEGWEGRADAAAEEVQAAVVEERSAVIERHSGLWRELVDALRSLSYSKCWYCETRQPRSDDSVDHFRPKNRVAERKDHPGYWWLAFDWWNYRLSCTFCNSRRRNKRTRTTGGKQDHFPLLDEAMRAYSAADDLGLENPMLLDPARAGDTTLLWFGDDGHVYPRSSPDRQPQYARADASIALYHLNHPNIVESRLVLTEEIRRLINAGNDLFDRLHPGNPEAARGHSEVVRQLEHKIRGSSQYSAAARDAVRGLRDNQHGWIDAL